MVYDIPEMIETYKNLPKDYHAEMEALSELVVEHNTTLHETDILRALAYYIVKSQLLEVNLLPKIQ